LTEWVHRARAACAAIDRTGIGDEQLGEILSGSPNGPDGAWPHPSVRDLIESLANCDIERGLEVGVMNSRGVVCRDPGEGGVQERQLVERYTGFAIAVADKWPRTAAMLRRIADRYRRDAAREDTESELIRDEIRP
jgi:hypothetical protein